MCVLCCSFSVQIYEKGAQIIALNMWRGPDSSFVYSIRNTADTTFGQIWNSVNTPLALERVFYLCCLKIRIQQANGWWNRNNVLTLHPSSPWL